MKEGIVSAIALTRMRSLPELMVNSALYQPWSSE